MTKSLTCVLLTGDPMRKEEFGALCVSGNV